MGGGGGDGSGKVCDVPNPMFENPVNEFTGEKADPKIEMTGVSDACCTKMKEAADSKDEKKSKGPPPDECKGQTTVTTISFGAECSGTPCEYTAGDEEKGGDIINAIVSMLPKMKYYGLSAACCAAKYPPKGATVNMTEMAAACKDSAKYCAVMSFQIPDKEVKEP